MQAFWTLARREVGAYFLSMTGYIIIASALFLMGFSFFDLIGQLHQNSTPMPITELFFVTWYFWLILLLTSPVITMRLFALEKFSGTFETLMTAPVSDVQVVLAKFAAALAFYVVMWLPLLGCTLVVRHYTTDPGAIDAGVIGSTFLGLLLLGGLFLALGCLASALTRSQVTAAIMGLLFGACLFLLGLLAQQAPSGGSWQNEGLAALSFFDQMHDFARGVVDTRPVVLYLTLTAFFLFLTLRIVESRRWK
jgi:ABC-2 type transport system permease protein